MSKKLSNDAYGGVKGKDYIPYVSSGTKLGGSPVVMVLGIILAALFGASTAYSGLKSGLTVAAGIPGAILGSGLISLFAKDKKILGKNLLQGMSSGGETVASGMIFVLPAVLLIGQQLSFIEGVLVGIAGILFGIGASSLVYNYLIIEEHGNLVYPESMAIAETLVASEGMGESMKFMGMGFGIGGLITLFTGSFLNKINNMISFVNEKFYKWRFSMEINPMLLGIGFIVGLKVSLMMFAGSLLANFAVLPLIGYFAELANDTATVWNDPSVRINAMQAGNIGGSYLRYMGAGMMLSGGLIGAIKLIPTVVSSVKSTLGAKRSGSTEESSTVGYLILLIGVIVAFVTGFVISGGSIVMALLASVLSLVLSLLFVIVSGRLTGTIGTSNLPVSGMTIASLILVTLLFVGYKWISPENNKSLLLFGTFIVTAIAMAGGYAQSQKVTFIMGGSKNEMQKYITAAAIVGVLAVVGVIVLLSGELAKTGETATFDMPQANLMATLTKGIVTGELPWPMLISGIFIGIFFYILGLPVMTVSIGFYLPISTTSIILVGALIRQFVEMTTADKALRDARVSNGISLSSGLVAGASIIGLIGVILQVTNVFKQGALSDAMSGNIPAVVLLVALVLIVAGLVISKKTVERLEK